MMLEEARLQEVIQQLTGELAGALHMATVVAGQRLGLFRALAEVGPASVADIAAAASSDPDLVEQWLIAQYLSGCCQFSPQTGVYWLSPEQQAVLADPSSPTYLLGALKPDHTNSHTNNNNNKEL